MSNIQKAFLPLLFFSLLSTQAIASPQISRADSITKRAEYLFRFEKYKEGISAYETLYQEGYFTEKSLYRLAFMHEQEGNFASSIYYLRKIQWEYGGPNIESKIAQLLRQYRQGQQPLGNMWTSTQRFIYHHQGNISIGILITTLLIAIFVVAIPHRLARALGIMASTALLLFCLLVIANHSFVPTKGVLIQETSFYRSPGYASEIINLPLGPGTMVDIKEEQDIWTKIQTTRFEAWVPTFILKKI